MKENAIKNLAIKDRGRHFINNDDASCGNDNLKQLV